MALSSDASATESERLEKMGRKVALGSAGVLRFSEYEQLRLKEHPSMPDVGHGLDCVDI